MVEILEIIVPNTAKYRDRAARPQGLGRVRGMSTSKERLGGTMDVMWGVGNKEQRETENQDAQKQVLEVRPALSRGGFSGHRRRGELGIGGRK